MPSAAELQIFLRTIADLSGVEQLKGGIASVNSDIAAQLKAAGAAFDPITKSFKSIAAEGPAVGSALSGAAKAAEDIASGGLLAGINLNRARGEALTLARELATGSVNSRTLGALLGSFGSTLAVAGVAGYVLFEGVSKLGQDWRDVDEQINKSSDNLNTQVGIWDALAGAAGKFADVVALGATQVSELTKLTQQLAAIKAQPLGVIDKIQDFVSRTFNSAIPGLGASPNADAKNSEVQRAQDELNRALLTSVATQDKASESVQAWKDTLAELPTQALDEYNSKLTDEKGKLDALAANRGNSAEAFKAWQDQQKVVEQVSDRVDTLTKRENEYAGALSKSADATKLLHDQAGGNEQAVIADRVKTAYDEIYKSKLAAHVPDEEAKTLATQQSQALGEQLQAQLALKGATGGTVSDHRDLTALLHEEATILQGIRQQQQLIAADPFLSAEAKQEALRNLALQQQAVLLQQIARIRAAIAQIKAIGNPQEQAEVAQLNQKLQQLGFEYDLLGQKLKTLTSGGALQKSLADWVNGFGTAAAQIGQTIQGTINASLQGTNQLLTGLITGTGNWKQTLQGVESQIANVFLTWIEQMALQEAASLLHITTTSAAASASNTAQLATAAPLAAATSISSFGVSATVGAIAAVAAIAAIIAALTGAFAEGGVIPGAPSTRDNKLALVASGEGIIKTAAVQRYGGRSFIDAINQGRLSVPRFALGGMVSAGPGLGGNPTGGNGRKSTITIIQVRDEKEAMDEYLKSSAAETHIVRAVNRRGGGLRS